MTTDDIKKRVAKIEAEADDDEAAHSDEDDLWLDVLTAIANGAPNAAELAAEAIKTQDIQFGRWHA